MRQIIIYISTDLYAIPDDELKTSGETNDELKDWYLKNRLVINKHNLSTLYSLEGFCLAFNQEHISDQGIIILFNESELAIPLEPGTEITVDETGIHSSKAWYNNLNKKHE